MTPLETGYGGGWPLADPGLVVDFLGTRRRRGDALTGELPDDHEASQWVSEHFGEDVERVELIRLREQLHVMFAAIVDGFEPPGGTLEMLNGLAGQGPVTLIGRHTGNGIEIERAGPGPPTAMLTADIARSALVLLAEPARGRLRLCRAPGCTLFFLTDRPQKQWCSDTCGNRARAARYYARHRSG